jgi:hypothetical protein
MVNPILDAETVLAIDIGSIHTRGLLFDLVAGQYRFVSASRVPSTARAPFFDISEGIYQAVQSLQELTSRYILDDTRLIIPADEYGRGIDQLVMTFSTPQALKVVIMGLLEDVSLESARRLVNSAHCQIVEEIGINDRRKPSLQIDSLVKANSDLVLIAGGTDNGATRSILKLVDLLSLALQVLPRADRPLVIYAGNQALAETVQELLGDHTEVQIAPNIRPQIDHEDLGPAQQILSEAIRQIRIRQIGGLQSYSAICSDEPGQSSQAFGRMIRFLSQINNPQKGVLGIDLGASSTTIAAAREGNLELIVSPIGLGAGLARALEENPLESITRWLPIHLPDSVVRDMLAQKTLFPEMMPSTPEALAVEQAVARQVVATAMRKLPRTFASSYEPILASGPVLTQSTPGQCLMMLLDSIQPGGVTTFVLDPHGLTPALGAIARFNSILPVQVIESNAFINLATVIAPVSNAKYGTPILQVRVEYDAGEDLIIDVLQGTLTPLPIQPGQTVKIHLRPLRPLSLDPNQRDYPRSYKIIGGLCGAVIDTRGRPIQLPKDAARRRDMLKKWAMAINA